MAFAIEHLNEMENSPQPAPVGATPPSPSPIIEELNRILDSKFFRNAVRSRQFLEFVVQHKLEGHAEQLKERTIGVEIFQRSPEYPTGEDPVVRVQAGEVRRRLEQYYQLLPSPPIVRIELQPGSYSPRFHWTSADAETAAASPQPPSPNLKGTRIPRLRVMILGTTLILLLAAGLIYSRFLFNGNSSIQEEFWAPVFSTPQPVLICLAKPVVYRPSFDLYQSYAEEHPGTFLTEVERSNQVLPLAADQKVPWSEMVPYPDYGVAVGDAYAAVRISSLLGKIEKPSQVRIGANYSFADLDNSPSVIVGAFNNKWAMQIMSGLHFSFVEDKGQYTIRERAPGGRVWRPSFSQAQQNGEDFAIVARLFDSRTGQFTIVAAGITGSGTEAAGEFISDPGFLQRGLRGISADWQRKNMEIILKTAVTDSVAGPPQVITFFVW